MFETLSDRLEGVFKKLRGQGRITESNIEEAVREVRLALLEADVNIKVVKDFVEHVKRKALGQEVLRSLSPEQHLIRFVATELREVMGGNARELDLKVKPPVKIMLVGLQGSGKTTSLAKLARWLKADRKRHPLMVSVDIYRPAAMEQLRVLGRQIDVPVVESHESQDPVEIATNALGRADVGGYDVVLLDTAGRLQIDEEMMDELVRLQTVLRPHHVLLVADAMTGQDAVNVAQGFHDRLKLSGVILTKLDSDARGGAALSVRAVTGAPILFAATGEKLDAFDVFHPDRLATRILGMGDVLTLIEKAQQTYDQKQAKELERKFKKNEFTLEDFAQQMIALQKMGSLGDLLGMIPGFKKIASQVDSDQAQQELSRIKAIIDSMTRQERRNHLILNGSRRMRIATGSGTSVQEVNRFVKQFEQTRKMMKKIAKGGGGRGMLGGFGLGG
ncbi:MAG TPA: signal recognition particle protein [Candidatus Binataceae bacterium]|jgi:signal recognition particle subunit SRP54|nr:signal recognition particle protein [Candidatus Binataceae bacterium]